MHLHLTGGRFFSQEAMACATGVAAGAAGAQGPQAFASLATTWASGGAAGAAADLPGRTAIRQGHLGGPAFRWDLPGASMSMKRQVQWNLDAQDFGGIPTHAPFVWSAMEFCAWSPRLPTQLAAGRLCAEPRGRSRDEAHASRSSQDYLGAFIATLPPPILISQQPVQNRKGGDAEVIILRYSEAGGGRKLYHGTHLGGVQGILRDGGFKDSADHSAHEFSMPGVYAVTNPFDTLEPYAVSVMMTAGCPWSSWTTPYTKVILVVEADEHSLRAARKTEEVFSSRALRVLEVHFLRGYDFATAAGKFESLTPLDVAGLGGAASRVAFTNLGLPHPWSPHSLLASTWPTSCSPPPHLIAPAAIPWTRWLLPAGRAFYINTDTGLLQLAEPSTPFVDGIGPAPLFPSLA